MKITEFNKRVAKIEAKKRQVSIAQIAEITAIINKMTMGAFYAIIRLLPVIFFCLLFLADCKAQTITPRHLWTFDSPNPAGQIDDSMNVMNLSYGGTLTPTAGGQVSKYGDFTTSTGLVNGPSDFTAFKDSFAIEFLIKPGYDFNSCKIFTTGNSSVEIKFNWPNTSLVKPYINFYTQKSSGETNDFNVILDGVGRKNWGYLVDGNWHHFVFQYSCLSGKKEIWIDGQLPSGFSTQTPTGGSFATATQSYISSSVNYVKIYAGMDEIAMYTRTLPGKHVLEHYNNFIAGNHYAYNTAITSVPSADAVTAAINSDDYESGHTQTTVSWTVPLNARGPDGEPQGTAVTKIWSTGATRTAIQQLQWYPVPRFKYGHTMLPNINVCGVDNAAGNGQTVPVITSPALYTQITQVQNRTNLHTMTNNLVHKWNMTVHLDNINGQNADFSNVNTDAGMLTKLANDSVEFPLSLGMYRAQINPLITSQSQTNSNYMQNAAGQYLNELGNVITNKYIRLNNSSAQYNGDGLAMRATLNALITALPNRPSTRKIDHMWENGEWHPIHTDRLYLGTSAQVDPILKADQQASGLDWYTYASRKYHNINKQSWQDQFQTLTGLTSTRYAEYTLTGANNFLWKWREVRDINSPQVASDFLSTPDYYFQYPYNWRNWAGAFHGIGWGSITRAEEVGMGDDFNSPFVSAGWYIDEEKNMRPAQYLGCLKIIAGMGAKFFYNSYFGNLYNPFALPESWIWQMVTPCYVQAAVSRHQSDFDNSRALVGDFPQDYVSGADSSFIFKTGDLRKIVTIRKVTGAEKYLIFGTLQGNTNMSDALSVSGNATITLPNVGAMTFQVRRQGSIYYLDNTTPSAPIFYQLDGWHENKHPDKWTQDMNIEAELYDIGGVTVETEGISGTDYTSAVSYISMTNGQQVDYKVQRSELSTSTRYLWIRARSTNGSDCGVTIAFSGYAAKSIECIQNTSWAWYRVDKTSGTVINYTSMTTGVYDLLLTAISNIEIDKIAFAESSADLYGASTTTCAGVVTASITPSIASPFCSYSGPVTLSASAGTSYLWSTGATTQTISTNTSGTYTVTVTVLGVGSDTDTEVVTVEPAPVISPITNISNTCPEDSASFNDITVVNTGQAGTLTWHATKADALANANPLSDSITATGYYHARITVASGLGCYDTDSVKVDINSCGCATPPQVYAGSDKTICAGLSVTMTGTKGAGTGSTSWSGGAGSFSDASSLTSVYYPAGTDLTNGYVNLVLTSPDPDGGGPCTVARDTVKVTINALPTVTISVNNPSSIFCAGTTRTLTATANTSYLWSTSAATQSISISSGGTYTVTVTNSAGCTKSTYFAISQAQPVSVNLAATTTSVCVQGSVTLSVSPQSSYLWSTGATTQTISVGLPGTYTVTVTASSGCTGTASTAIVDTCLGIGCPVPYNLTATNIGYYSARINFSCGTPDIGIQLYLRNTITGKVMIRDYNKNTRSIRLWGLKSNTTYEYYITAKCSSGNRSSVMQTFKTQ